MFMAVCSGSTQQRLLWSQPLSRACHTCADICCLCIHSIQQHMELGVVAVHLNEHLWVGSRTAGQAAGQASASAKRSCHTGDDRAQHVSWSFAVRGSRAALCVRQQHAQPGWLQAGVESVSCKPEAHVRCCRTCSASCHCPPLSSAVMRLQQVTASHSTPSATMWLKTSIARPHWRPLDRALIKAEYVMASRSMPRSDIDLFKFSKIQIQNRRQSGSNNCKQG